MDQRTSQLAAAETSPAFAATIYLAAFITGAIVMSFEMLGSRYLNPYFGSGIYTWASLISTVLAALCVGYFIGGIAADRYPSAAVLGATVLIGSAYILVLPLFSERLMEAVVAELTTARANADKAQEAAADALQKAKSVRDLVSKQRAEVEAQTKKYTDLLATLNAQQQEQYRDRNAPTAAQLATTQTTQAPTAPAQPAAPPAVGGGSAKAQIAVAYARAQLGKPYVFAAAGPDAFDCSGLTMMAWAAAGVSLPHYAPSQMQYGSTVPIDVSAMLPGDLIFLYPDIGHVEIYAGNGMAISAPQPGDVVKYVSVAYDMPNIVGVRRIA